MGNIIFALISIYWSHGAHDKKFTNYYASSPVLGATSFQSHIVYYYSNIISEFWLFKYIQTECELLYAIYNIWRLDSPKDLKANAGYWLWI